MFVSPQNEIASCHPSDTWNFKV